MSPANPGGLRHANSSLNLVAKVLACLVVCTGCTEVIAHTIQPIRLEQGMKLERSTVVAPDRYAFKSDSSLARPAVTIQGEDITVDFSGATLLGSSPGQTPDEYQGVALLIQNSRRVTIRNLNARGYKVALLARNVQGLTIENCDFSYNWKQRLKSTIDREDLSDWMSFHHNEKDEWLRYGAGMYLIDCDDAEIRNNTILQGQCGLMMTRCNRARVWNNNFSFLSGIGIGMYRSSHNAVMHNRLDWCVRGYSHGKYHRGQDSAAILVYEQSNNNLFAYNSATHSGDGFFLWAGQTTMDTGQGGCNDNLLYGNDFSHAPTNGVEMTFSRNFVINNRIDECDHGVWGGYSYESVIAGNQFADNRIAIAIEHGQDNRIEFNTFQRNRTGIRLWQNEKQDPNWGYPRHRDTRSRDYLIKGNDFLETPQPIELVATVNVAIEQNAFPKPDSAVKATGDTPGMKVRENVLAGEKRNHDLAFTPPKPIEGAQNAMLDPSHPRGRKFMLVDEWGPYDFRSPKLWPRVRKDDTITFDILGPAGAWRVKEKLGIAKLSAENGRVPGELTVHVSGESVVDLVLQLEYVGAEVVTPFGETVAAGRPSTFEWREFVAPIDWRVKFFAWDDATDPRERPAEFSKLMETASPLLEQNFPRLDFAGSGGVLRSLPRSRYGMVATGKVVVPTGRYAIETTSDDGVRVYVDGKRVIDNWTWHVPTLDRAELDLSGSHDIRVEYFQIDGYATIKFELKPVRK